MFWILEKIIIDNTIKIKNNTIKISIKKLRNIDI